MQESKKGFVLEIHSGCWGETAIVSWCDAEEAKRKAALMAEE